jgi:hypothetical protein
MDQPTGGTTPDTPITLSFAMTSEDVRHGLSVQAKAASRSGANRWLVLVVVVVAVLFAFAAASTGLRFSTDGLVLLLPVVVLVLVLVLWTQRRSQQRLAETHGQLDVRLDDTGVTVVSATARTESTWAAYGRYAETSKAFVLLSPGRSALIFTTLPKRALASQADAERLRVLLDRHLPKA